VVQANQLFEIKA